MGEYDRATSSERMLFVVVLLVIGTLVLWAAVSNVLGPAIGP